MTTNNVSAATTSSQGTGSTFLGVASGLPLETLVSKLMAVENLPVTQLQSQKKNNSTKISAYAAVSSSLSLFQSALNSLTKPGVYNTLTASQSNNTYFTASASASALPGKYNIEVKSLAAAQSLSSKAYATTTSSVGSGVVNIQFGTADGNGSFSTNANAPALSVTLDSSNNTLTGLANAINAANRGVTAAIVNDGSGYRLTLTSTNTGTANSMKISTTPADGSGLSDLNYDPAANANLVTQTQKATDAVIKVNGLQISNSSNTITDAIQGVTLNLTQAAASGSTLSTSLSIARDYSGLTSAIQGFVSAYNSASSGMNSLSAFDTQSGTGKPLNGDSTVRVMQAGMRAVLSNSLKHAGGGMSNLVDIGISFQKDGSLGLDASKLQKALADPAKNIASLFTTMGTPTDSQISYAASSTSTQAGKYAINISRMAAQGQLKASAPAADLTIDESNNNFSLAVDGVSVNVTLPQGSYTATTLAAALQSQINGAPELSAKGLGVVVTSDANGALTLTSKSYGSASSISIKESAAATNLFGASPQAVAGVDVQGSIGGQAATGVGQTGSRGTVAFENGIATQMGRLLNSFLATDGLIQASTNGLNTQNAQADKRIADLNNRLAAVEANYRKQFSALDKLIGNMQMTQNFLTQQLASLPKIGIGKSAN